MNEFRYEVYYQYDGPSHLQPFVKRKTETQVREALSDFVRLQLPYLDDLKAEARSEPIEGKADRINVILNTSEEDQSVDAAFDKCLRYLDLRAQRI